MAAVTKFTVLSLGLAAAAAVGEDMKAGKCMAQDPSCEAESVSLLQANLKVAEKTLDTKAQKITFVQVSGATLTEDQTYSILNWISSENDIDNTDYCNRIKYDRGNGVKPSSGTSCAAGKVLEADGMCYTAPVAGYLCGKKFGDDDDAETRKLEKCWSPCLDAQNQYHCLQNKACAKDQKTCAKNIATMIIQPLAVVLNVLTGDLAKTVFAATSTLMKAAQGLKAVFDLKGQIEDHKAELETALKVIRDGAALQGGITTSADLAQFTGPWAANQIFASCSDANRLQITRNWLVTETIQQARGMGADIVKNSIKELCDPFGITDLISTYKHADCTNHTSFPSSVKCK